MAQLHSSCNFLLLFPQATKLTSKARKTATLEHCGEHHGNSYFELGIIAIVNCKRLKNLKAPSSIFHGLPVTYSQLMPHIAA